MSDYMFMLESHLRPGQNKVVAAVEETAAKAEISVFLTGGAMRDVLGGFPVTDLDFTAQGNALALARKVAKNTGARIVSTDGVRKSAELLFPDGVTAEIAMSRMERFTKPGRPPRVQPATIHEDLLRRDFTVNSIALSLHPASRGLLLDPANGHADLERREPPQTLFLELKQTAQELNGGEVLAELEREKLIHLFSPALAGSKLNLAVLARLHRAREMIPFGVDLRFDSLGLFLYFMTEKLTPEEKTALARRLVMS
jgi:hypothetical protein